MADIYVEVGDMDVTKAPREYAARAKSAMESGVTDAVKKASGFTATKKGEGFSVELTLSELTVNGSDVSCRLNGALFRYPKKLLVTKGMTGGSKVSGGKPDDLVEACVGAVVADLMKKAIDVMKKNSKP